MIDYIEKDITEVEKGIIIHGVNCQGVMGSGVALALKEKYPTIFSIYKKEVFQHLGPPSELLGRCLVIKIKPDLYIVDAFTQENFGKDGRKYVSYDAVDKCFRRLIDWRKGKGLTHLNIYFPTIGCGLGGGNWKVVQNIIEIHLNDDEVAYCCVKPQATA